MPDKDLPYEPGDIEEAVQKYWQDTNTFSVTEDPNKEKFYYLAPQKIKVGDKIQNGEIRASLILGGESRFKMLRSSIEKKDYIETPLITNPDIYDKSSEDLQLDIDEKELGSMAVGYYAILENAFRASLNKDIKSHSEYISKMYSHFSKVASVNDDAWIDNPLNPSEIGYVSSKNP